MVQYPEVKELLEMAANKSLWNDRTQNGQRKNPIIAVEGLDAAGIITKLFFMMVYSYQKCSKLKPHN